MATTWPWRKRSSKRRALPVRLTPRPTGLVSGKRPGEDAMIGLMPRRRLSRASGSIRYAGTSVLSSAKESNDGLVHRHKPAAPIGTGEYSAPARERATPPRQDSTARSSGGTGNRKGSVIGSIGRSQEEFD